MYHSRKVPLEVIPEEMTDIWSCTSDDCNLWMRINFSMDEQPVCPKCKTKMIETKKMLTPLANNSLYRLKS